MLEGSGVRCAYSIRWRFFRKGISFHSDSFQVLKFEHSAAYWTEPNVYNRIFSWSLKTTVLLVTIIPHCYIIQKLPTTEVSANPAVTRSQPTEENYVGSAMKEQNRNNVLGRAACREHECWQSSISWWGVYFEEQQNISRHCMYILIWITKKVEARKECATMCDSNCIDWMESIWTTP